MRKTGPTNETLKKLIIQLRKNKKDIWQRVADELSRANRNKKAVNIKKINKYAKDGETVLVLGKVLSEGELTKKVIVTAFQFSDKAVEKIGKVMTIQELLEKNPKGTNVRLMK